MKSLKIKLALLTLSLLCVTNAKGFLSKITNNTAKDFDGYFCGSYVSLKPGEAKDLPNSCPFNEDPNNNPQLIGYGQLWGTSRAVMFRKGQVGLSIEPINNKEFAIKYVSPQDKVTDQANCHDSTNASNANAPCPNFSYAKPADWKGLENIVLR